MSERILVKICGITTAEAADAAARCGADAVGFVFFEESPRRIRPSEAARLAARLPSSVARVAVFHDPAPVEAQRVLEILRPDLVQVEPESGLMASLPAGAGLLAVIHDGPGALVRARGAGGGPVLLDPTGRGGAGVRVDWDRARRIAREMPLYLAGGLDPGNVAGAIRHVRPHGVDVSSGVESRPGVKDPARIERFLAAVRRVERTLAAEEADR